MLVMQLQCLQSVLRIRNRSVREMSSRGVSLCLFFVWSLSSPVCGDVDDMFKAIKGSVELMKNMVEGFEQLFKFALPGYRCINVISDHSPFAEYHLDDLHQCLSVPPVELGYFDETHGCEGFVILATSTASIPKTISEYPLYAEHRFIIIVPPVSQFRLNSLISKKNIFGESEIVIASTKNLSRVYRLGQPQRDRFEVVDDFSTPWEVEDEILDFQARTIRALTYNCSMFSQIGPLNSDGSANYTYGAEMQVFTDIVSALNLTIKWSVLENMTVHSMFFNTKKWYMKPITSEGASDVDVAFCGLTLSYKKMKGNIEMSQPSVLLCFRFLVPRPKKIQAEWNSLFTVFDVDLWMTIALATLVTSFILQKITKQTTQYVQTEGIGRYTKLGGSAMQLFSILVLSDVPDSKESQGASRHILSFWSFSAMVLTTCFSSGLVSHLTSQSYAKKIDTVEELVQSKFHWGFLYKPDYSELLNTGGNVMHARLRMRAVNMKSLQEHIQALKEGRQFLWGVQIQNGFFLPEEDLPHSILDKFEVADDCFIDYFLSYAFRTGTPYRPAFDKFMRTYRETGLLKREFDRKLYAHSRKKPYVYRVLRLTTPQLSGGGLELYHLTGIIEIWAVGLGLSIVVFILEIFQKCHI